MKQRSQSIDTLRGLACILLVGYHVIGSMPSNGLKIESGYFRDINDILGLIRMPLFTFLSGLVYAYRPFDQGFIKYTKGKLRRLIIPMLIVGTLFAVMQSIVPGSNFQQYDWSMLHIIPVAHFWFIESLFIIFLLIAGLEVFAGLDKKNNFLIVFIIACVLYLLNIKLNYFSISGVIYLLPFFLAGMAIQRFSLLEIIKPKLGYLMLFSVFVVLLFILFDYVPLKPKHSIEALVIGILFCVGVLSIKRKNNILAIIGGYSYSIYLFHVFFTAGSRVILYKIGMTDLTIIFLISIFLGLLFPIIAERILNGTNTTRTLFMGKSTTNINNLWFTRQITRTDQDEPAFSKAK